MIFSMSLSKAEKIMAFLNQWDPEGTYKTSQDYRVYSYEADTIAQGIKSNSSLKAIEKVVQEAFQNLDIEGEDLKKIAQVIKAIR